MESEVSLGDLITARIGDEQADFWIVRRGSIETVGQPTNVYNPEHIGVTIIRPEVLLPNYLFYAIQHVWLTGAFKSRATGTTDLVNIKVSDILGMKFS